MFNGIHLSVWTLSSSVLLFFSSASIAATAPKFSPWYQPILKCMPSWGVFMTRDALVERFKQREGRSWPACWHLEFKAPEGVPQVQLLAWGPLLHQHSVGHNPSVCFSTAMTDMLLVNQWDWPSPRVSTAWGPLSPHWHNEILTVSGSVPQFHTTVEMIDKI